MRRFYASIFAFSIIGSLLLWSDIAAARSEPSEFSQLRINVEQNFSDMDTEIVIHARAGSEGLRKFKVKAPNGDVVLDVKSNDKDIMGLRDLAFESPEPEGAAILEGYPEGIYSVTGVTHSGEKFAGQATLSHALPGATDISFVQGGSRVLPEDLDPGQPFTLQWAPVAGVEQYLLAFDNESDPDLEQKLNLNLPPSVTSFDWPASLLDADATQIQFGVGTVASGSGNVRIVEVQIEFVE